MTEPNRASRWTYTGVFLVALATLMYEILLTRIFSVKMWYHYAFMAISVAMFGMTVGALIVYLLPRRFPVERAKKHLAVSAICFAVSLVAGFAALLQIPTLKGTGSLPVFSLSATYVVTSVPFIFSGVCICLALTRFPRQVSRVYAADLVGAATGCVLLIYTLKAVDGLTAILVVGCVAAVASALFSAEAEPKRWSWFPASVSIALAVSAAALGWKAASGVPLFRLGGVQYGTPIYEKWNSFSRITVSGDPNRVWRPHAGALSPAIPYTPRARQLSLAIDGVAETVLTAFDGDLRDVDFLRYDMINTVHRLRDDARVLVIGAGGGRDVLSALAFDQEAVTAVEINENIIRAVNGRFGDYTGHLDRNPKVTFVNDEARSYIARSDDRVDIIQVSLIDTWAATASGAFALAENALYTLEAWDIFLDHLEPDGILTFTRWYFRDRPGAIYRLVALATAALKEAGAENPREHLALLRCMTKEVSAGQSGKGTLLVCKQPFSDEDLDTLEAVAHDLRFELVLSPRASLDPVLTTLASGRNLEAFTENFPIDISPPTDDKPFFFNMLRLRDVFDEELRRQGVVTFNMEAVYVLAVLLITVLVLTLLCIVLPLAWTTRRATLAGAAPLLLFFAAIGFGFMLIEISQMQRLIVFLGHPTYGLSVVLFTMLLFSGLGSFLTRNVGQPALTRSGAIRLLVLLAVLGGFGLAAPLAVKAFEAAVTPVRIGVAGSLLAAIGLFMGMPFPLGMKVAAAQKSQALAPWLWGINGATSVCASVLAIAIALTAGIAATFWTGVGCYVVALLAFLWAGRG